MTSLTAPSRPFLSENVPIKAHREATTPIQRYNARPDSFQLLLQSERNPMQQLCPDLALVNPAVEAEEEHVCFGSYDYLIRHLMRTSANVHVSRKHAACR